MYEYTIEHKSHGKYPLQITRMHKKSKHNHQFSSTVQGALV